MYRKIVSITALFFVLFLAAGCSRANDQSWGSYDLPEAEDVYELFILTDCTDPDIVEGIKIQVESVEEGTSFSVDRQSEGSHTALVYAPGTYIVSVQSPALKPVSAYVFVKEEKIYMVYIPVEAVSS